MVLLLTTQSFAQSFYQSSTVTELNSTNFDRVVLQSDRVWIVQLYAKWCGHSRQAVREFIKLGNCLEYGSYASTCSKKHIDLNNSVHVGAIDVDDNDKTFLKQFNLTSVPTFRIYGRDKSAPIAYRGARSAYGILAFVLEMISIEDETISDYGSGVEPNFEEYTTTEAAVEIMDDDSKCDYDDESDNDYEIVTEWTVTSAEAETEIVDEGSENVVINEPVTEWTPTSAEFDVEIVDEEAEDVFRSDAITDWTLTSVESEAVKEGTEDVSQNESVTEWTQSSE